MDEEERQSKMLFIQPSIVVSAGMEGVNPYARIGMVAAKGKVLHTSNTTIVNTTPQGRSEIKEELEFEFSGGWAIGMQGAVGVDFKLNEKISFFSEITMNSLNYSPARGKVLKNMVNGSDKLADMPVREKEAEFVDEIETSSSSNAQPDNSKPDQVLKFYYPLSSVGVGVGIKLKF